MTTKELGDYLRLNDMLKYIEDNADVLKRLEGRTSVVIASHIVNMHDTMVSLGSASKALSEMNKNPFEPAVLDNAAEAYRDFCTAWQVGCAARSMDDDGAFDARDIIDVKLLRECVEIWFRSTANIHDKMFRNVGVILIRVICEAYITMRGLTRENIPDMNGINETERNQCEIRFTLLDKQKYFTGEEKAKLEKDAADAENRRQAIMRENELKKQILAISDEISHIYGTPCTLSGIPQGVTLSGYACLINNIFPLGKFETIVKDKSVLNLNDTGVIIKGRVNVGQLTDALMVLEELFKVEYDLKSDDLGTSIMSGDVDANVILESPSVTFVKITK